MQKSLKKIATSFFLPIFCGTHIMSAILLAIPQEVLGISDEFIKGLSMDGLLEVEAGYHKDYGEHSQSDIILATAYLGISAKTSEWSQARLAFLYEQNATDLQIDDAYIRLGKSLSLTLGQRYLPFGKFESNLVSDPLTYDMSHTLRTIAQLEFENETLSGSIYAYRGGRTDEQHDTINHYGAHFSVVNDHFEWGIGYLNHFEDTHGPFEATQDINIGDETVSGLSTYVLAHFGHWNVIGEYLGALESFSPDILSFADRGAKPRTWNMEIGYQFDLLGKETVFAVAYQGSQDALPIELAQKRYGGAIAVEIFERTHLTLEYLREQDYSLEEGGTGKNSDTITLQCTLEF